MFCCSLQGSIDNGKGEVVLEPSPTKAVIRKVIGSLVCAFIFMKFVKIYPVKDMKEEDFLEDTSMVYKFWYAMMATTCIRFKYYHAWLLADAICNNSGLGFTGYDKDGQPKWDLISNINVLSFEVCNIIYFIFLLKITSFFCDSFRQICAMPSRTGIAAPTAGCEHSSTSECPRNTALCSPSPSAPSGTASIRATT